MRFVTLRGLTFRHAARTVMDTENRCCARIGPSIAAARFSSKAPKIARWKIVFLIRSVAMPFSSTITTAG